MAISIQNELTSVSMALPVPDNLDINAAFDCLGNKHTPEPPMSERREA
jgi:hypothetical protein